MPMRAAIGATARFGRPAVKPSPSLRAGASRCIIVGKAPREAACAASKARPAWIGSPIVASAATHKPTLNTSARMPKLPCRLSRMIASFVAALLAVLAGIALTGAFHEDGLADTADGFGGG